MNLNIIVLLGMASAEALFCQVFLLCRQRVLQHTRRVGWLRFLVLECLFHSPRASSNLVYGFVAVLRRELLNVIFAFSHGVAPGVVAEISFPLLPVSALSLSRGSLLVG